MSKNIIIQQDGQGHSLNNVPKISTTTLEGGSCTWVPEDEADTYARTQTLRVDENGTYTPEEGYAGFSEVTVDVEPTLTTRHITENGTYRASDEQADGYSLVSVAVPSASNLGSKMISENGTFRATDDDLDGYDVVYVNVTSIGGEDYSVDVGEDQVNIVVTDEDTEYNYGVDPETDIASMIVTDPDDGEKYIVSVEPDGTITRKLFPTRMVITTPPTKTTYTEGETMNYTGIVCTLYDKAGNVFTDDVYTTGVIPFAELEFPVTVAPEGEWSGITEPLTSTYYRALAGMNRSLVFEGNTQAQVESFLSAYNNSRGQVYATTNTGAWGGWSPVTIQVFNDNDTFSPGHGIYVRIQLEMYANGVDGGELKVERVATSASVSTMAVEDQTVYATNYYCNNVSNEDASTASIPVLWRAPTSHFPVTMTFRETFEIEVTDA